MSMRRRRTMITAAESADLWERWKNGEGLKAIGLALGRGHTSIAAHIGPSGASGRQPGYARRGRYHLRSVKRSHAALWRADLSAQLQGRWVVRH